MYSPTESAKFSPISLPLPHSQDGYSPAVGSESANTQVAPRFRGDSSGVQFGHDHIFDSDVEKSFRRIWSVTCLALGEEVHSIWESFI